MNPTIDPVQQFFAMFAQANAAIWPLQLVWYAAAVVVIWLAIRPTRNSSRLIAAFLAAYYTWLGTVFFGIYYAPQDDHAAAHVALFVVGGLFFLAAGVLRQDLQFQANWSVLGLTGGAMILYALVAYPIIDVVTGRYFPAAPVFGIAPCPSAIFTAGLLLWTRRQIPMYVLFVPLIWLLAQTPAQALALGVVADVARSVAGVVVAALLVFREYERTRDRLFAGALLIVGVFFLGHDDALMALGLVLLAVVFARWLMHRRDSLATSSSARAPGEAASGLR